MSHLREARALLTDDNLVWSDDFERVREPLARLLGSVLDGCPCATCDSVNDIAAAVIEADLTEPDPSDDWVYDAARQLGIIDQLAQHSHATAEALKRLFRRL